MQVTMGEGYQASWRMHDPVQLVSRGKVTLAALDKNRAILHTRARSLNPAGQITPQNGGRQVSCGVASITKRSGPETISEGLRETQLEKVNETQDWSWTKQWYPIAVVSDLDPSVPWGTKLLGKDLVLWRDGQGLWQALEDLCPHRLAPLSQGRIEPSDGSLQCSYHGWRFDGTGKAVSIPQASVDGEQVASHALASKRSCVAAYPVKEELGYLWVWPETGPEAAVESSQKETTINKRVRELSAGDVKLTTNLNFVRDFPVAYDIMVENISDQSHVPFAHHGVGGSRASKWAAHFQVSNVNKGWDGEDGYTYDLEWSPDGINPPIKQKVTMMPPTYIEYFTQKDDGFTAHWFYVVPLDEYNTRVINHAVHTFPIPGPLQWLAGKRPRWLDHLVLNEIFDGDMAYLTETEISAKKHDVMGRTWAKDYYLPAKADGGVIAWRKWFHGRGRSGYVEASEGTPALPPVIPVAQKFDRYNQHTKHCPSCSKALENLKTSQTVLKIAGVGMLLALASVTAQGDPLYSSTPLALLACSAGAFWFSSVLHSFEAKFIFQEYNHGKR
eukprot:jgi/Botrbrau1/11802/Bobra.0224s0008.2